MEDALPFYKIYHFGILFQEGNEERYCRNTGKMVK